MVRSLGQIMTISLITMNPCCVRNGLIPTNSQEGVNVVLSYHITRQYIFKNIFSLQCSYTKYSLRLARDILICQFTVYYQCFGGLVFAWLKYNISHKVNFLDRNISLHSSKTLIHKISQYCNNN